MSNRSPSRDVWLLPVASLLAPLLLLAVMAWRDYGQTFEQTERRVERTSSVLYEHALRLFETFRFVVDEVANHVEGMSWEEFATSPSLHRYLKRLDDGFSQVGGIWLNGPNGRVANSSIRFPVPATNVADRDYFRAMKEGAAFFVSDTYPGRTTGVPAFNLVRPRTGPDGRFDGMILTSASVSDFQDFFRRVLPDPRDSVSLLRTDGSQLVRDRDGPLIRLTADSGFMRAIAERPEAGVFRTVAQVDGRERIFAYRKLAGFPVYVVYGRAVKAVIEEWADRTAFNALFAVPLALLLATASWLVVRKAHGERVAIARLHQESERRRRAEELLQKIQRLEMLGQIAGGIAHDFNNLLMVITSNLYLAQARAGGEAGKGPGPFIDTAMQAAYRGGQLTQQLLTFSRQQTLKPEVLAPAPALAAMVDGMLKRSLRGDIAVEAELPADAWSVEVDRTQLELAVLNLAVNARDAMPDGGTLRIAVRNVTLDGGLDAPAGLAGDFVVLSVSDTGSGIDPAVRDRVFDPFFTTKEVGKGTGLGLSQVFGFASQSGGTVTLDSTVGAGTTVALYLPRSGKAPGQRSSPVPPPAPEGRGRRILLVEDSPEIGRTTTTLLEGFGYSVTLVDNARAALDTLTANGRFDFILSDIVMPGDINGLDLARSVRERYPDLPMMLTTGYSSAASTAVEEGFLLLHKPYRPEVLADAVNDLLAARARGAA
ncbi:ATP-binding protein [Azospirillum sp. ST 5-10]|uniref:hybrid sensor histidine kinase/response regulator n=1 Tax=unclassified Azospirillum TaxID=2630922 RepID=UPI003F49FB6C